MKKKCFLLFCWVSLFISSCGENNTKTISDSESSPITDSRTEETMAPSGEIIEVVIESDDNMRFNLSEIKVKEGQTIKLTLKHTGTMPKSAMGHNFVLLKKGADLVAFANAMSRESRAPDYDIPREIMDDVIAHTQMIGGGESDLIEFVAPPKGSYEFLCSFPGHYEMMRGAFIVE